MYPDCCREDVLILTSSGTAAVCNLGLMAELDTSGPVSGIMPGRMPGSEARILQVDIARILYYSIGYYNIVYITII